MPVVENKKLLACTCLLFVGSAVFQRLYVSNGPHFLLKKKIEEPVEECSFLFLCGSVYIVCEFSYALE